MLRLTRTFSTAILVLFSPSVSFSEDLFSTLAAAKDAVLEVKMASGSLMTGNIDLSSSNLQYSFTSSDGVCSGSLSLNYASSNSVMYNLEETTNTLDGCPVNGVVSFQKSASVNGAADIRMKFFSSSGENTAEAILGFQVVSKNSTSADASSVIYLDACKNFSWDAIIENLPDRFLCDEVRTIQDLSMWRSMEIKVERVVFENGILYAQMTQTDSYAKDMLSPEKINTINFSDALNIRMNAKQIYVSCGFRLPLSVDFKVGDTLQVRSKLIKYDQASMLDIVHLSCTLE